MRAASAIGVRAPNAPRPLRHTVKLVGRSTHLIHRLLVLLGLLLGKAGKAGLLHPRRVALLQGKACLAQLCHVCGSRKARIDMDMGTGGVERMSRMSHRLEMCGGRRQRVEACCGRRFTCAAGSGRGERATHRGGVCAHVMRDLVSTASLTMSSGSRSIGTPNGSALATAKACSRHLRNTGRVRVRVRGSARARGLSGVRSSRFERT